MEMSYSGSQMAILYCI